MFYVYIVRCNDNTLYTGWTVDLQRRVKEHNEGKRGAKYTRARRPVELVYYESFNTKVEAQKREYAIKQLRKFQKINLIKNLK